MKYYIKGNYQRSIFESNNGYTIGTFKVSETNEEKLTTYIGKTITFTGYFTELNKDDLYIFYGELIDHPKYGLQYKVDEAKRLKPTDKEGIVAFLSSHLFKGIGEKLAKQIVSVLGPNSLDKILEEKECLLLVPKMSTKKMNIIYDTLTNYEKSHKTVIYLTDLGFNMKDSLTIYNYYKDDTIYTLKNDIYKILDDIGELSFIKIDQISFKLGYEVDDARRIKACIIYIMKNLSFKNGDIYSTLKEISGCVNQYLKVEIKKELLIDYIDALRYENKIIKEEERYYLKENYDDELLISSKISYLISKPIKEYKKIDTELLKLEKRNKAKYNEEQKKAIVDALNNNITIITGGPGTGKTTIIRAIVDMYQILNDYDADTLESKLALLAPTGRASKRMCEISAFKATTIHRFLKWNKDNNTFLIDEFNKNSSEFIIIDEVSMIDNHLLASLFRGLTDNIKLVLVGDYNQLPSVGAGEILKDLIDSKMINTIKLETLYRQNENSYINVLAKEIKDNNLSDNYLKTTEDYTFIKCLSSDIKNQIEQLASKINKKEYDFKDFQFLAPMYAGVNGIDNINKKLQEVFNKNDPSKKEIKYGDVIFREGDKILQLTNMPDYNVFNGDTGIIEKIIYSFESESKKNEIYINFDGNTVKYLPNDFAKIKHGYIISIHKSQGSEFGLVIIILCKSYYKMLYRKLVYTAITRAKNKLILLGEVDSFNYSVQNNLEIKRKTTLKERIKNMYK